MPQYLHCQLQRPDPAVAALEAEAADLARSLLHLQELNARLRQQLPTSL